MYHYNMKETNQIHEHKNYTFLYINQLTCTLRLAQSPLLLDFVSITVFLVSKGNHASWAIHKFSV